jgi:L-iditol 2-dehydrogenase
VPSLFGQLNLTADLGGVTQERRTNMTEVPNSARAAVLLEYGKPLEIRELRIPELEPGAILVRNEMAGVCGTDVHLWRGAYGGLPLPLIMGHETVGRIVKIAAGRTSDCAGEPLKVGDRILAAHAHCGECYWCLLEGRSNLCINRMVYGFGPSSDYPYLMGGFAEYSYVLPKSQVVKVPEVLSNEDVAGIACAFSIVMHAFGRLGATRHQDTIVILGAGPVGLYSLLLAEQGGTGKVILIGAPEARLLLGKRWGADHTMNIAEQTNPSERLREVRELTRGIGADVVVECAGVPEAFNEGLSMVRRGGRFLVIGQTSAQSVDVMPGIIVNNEIDIIGSTSADISDYYRALKFTVNNRMKFPLADIVSHKYRLDQANEALEAMEMGRETKPVIVP